MTEWMNEALCRGMDPRPWFADELPSNAADRHRLVAAAKAICGACPVRDDCLADAMSTTTRNFDGTGIWGGLTPLERRRMRARSARTYPHQVETPSPTRLTG